MRLLGLQDHGKFSLVEFQGNDNIPPYAILSHTWGPDKEEVTYRDLVNDTGQGKSGYDKIRFCGKQARKDGLHYFWVDTCCIDKSSSQEVTESINSMFRWYQNSARCYAYLSDVSIVTPGNGAKSAVKKSKWFTRGWTLQELIAPRSVDFFSKEGSWLGNKASLEHTLHEITGIAIGCLRGSPLSYFTVRERKSWAEKRQTKKEEDEAYCLLGIFDIYMPLIYGEGREKALVRLEKKIERNSKNRSIPLNIEEKEILLKSLQFGQIDARQMTVKKAHAKTCKWLLTSPEYLDWLDTTKQRQHHGFLWIKGKPGAGKSTIMKFALAHARRAMRNKVVISFFFNARGDDVEKSTVGTYRSLLFQLLTQLPELQRIFDWLSPTELSTCINHQWGVELLKELFEQAIELLGKAYVVCFIDALDECEERQVRDMVQFFSYLAEFTVSAGIRFQVCFSSRHYPHITIDKGLSLVLEGQIGHNQDISNYLKSELKIGRSKLARQIRSELQEKASGVFMWVVLVIGILNMEYDRGRIHVLRRRLQEIPSDLYELFQDILTRDSRNTDEVLLCIQWVLFANQPLGQEQLYFAILVGIEPEAVSEWDPNETTMDVIKQFILACSKGLTEVTTSKLSKVQLIHESIRDFLLKGGGLGTLWPNLQANLYGKSHERLKQCCFKYMTMDIHSSFKIPRILPEAYSQQAESLHESANKMFPFLEYAVQNVLHHANVAEGSGITQAHFVRNFPLSRWITLCNILEVREDRRHKEDISLLYILAENNMSNLIRIHPDVTSCLDVGNERYGPPLFAAFATRSEAAVEVFIQALAADQLMGSYPYEMHCQNVRYKVVQQIIGTNFKFSKRRGVLSYSAEIGVEIVVAFLIRRGRVEINAKDEHGRTPLWWAAWSGHEAIVKLLLDTGKVDVNALDNDDYTPLSWAAQNGYEKVVKLLLETGRADLHTKDLRFGHTPLSWAARYGHHAVVKILQSHAKL
jgi:hypothetical protein